MRNQVLQIEGLRKVYGDRAVVDGVSFDVDSGEVVVLVGPNGSGKTTTIECIAGLRTPTAGAIVIGDAPGNGSVHDRSWLGIQLQESGLPPAITVREALALVASLYTDPMPSDELIFELGLTSVAGSRYEALSGGQKRRLDVGLAIVGRPPVVILDEPTSGVDPEGRAALWALVRTVVRTTGAGVLLTTHDLAEAEDHADRLLVLRDGRIVMSGAPSELLAKSAGEWRLRLRSATAVQRALVSQLAPRTIAVGDGLIAFGSRDEMQQLRNEVEATDVDAHTELAIGPTRLEDLFLLSRLAEPASCTPPH